MATVFNRTHHRPEQENNNLYNPPQMISMDIGFILIMISLMGIFNPEFLGLQMSPMHCLVLGGAGVLAVWVALTTNKKKIFWVHNGLGVFFMINAIAGFLLGEPGTSITGSDELILKIAPGFLELKTLDHTLHLFLSIFFFMDAYLWKKRQEGISSFRKLFKANKGRSR